MAAVRLRPVQLRDPSSLTSEAYVAQRAWQKASLAGCPRHARGGCGFARHGTYPRQTPAGMQIARGEFVEYTARSASKLASRVKARGRKRLAETKAPKRRTSR